MTANRLVAPCSKRRLGEWAERDAAMPSGWSAPSPDQYYRALDAVADAKADAEEHLYSRLCDLTNMDLALVCCDLTSTYFEAPGQRSDRFPSRAFGYSRDHRPDRPQVVIGLLCTGDGIPIAHHTFAGNTADASTLPGVLADLSQRFAVGRICVVADRGLISAANVEAVTAAGFDHVLATRLRRDPTAKEALQAIGSDTGWTDMPQYRCRAAETPLADGTRAIVVESDARARRDTARTAELVARSEAQLLDLEHRVRAGRLKDPAKIGRAAQRILGPSGIARLFDVESGEGRFVYHYDEQAHDWEKLLAGRYVLTTSLAPDRAPTERVVTAYRQLAGVEARFRTLTDFLRLRPIPHWTEQRVRGHVAGAWWPPSSRPSSPRPPNSRHRRPRRPDQHLTAPRALRELDRIPPCALPPRTPHRARHPPQPPPSQHPHRHRRRHTPLGQHHHRLTPKAPPAADVVETPPARAPLTSTNANHPPNSGQVADRSVVSTQPLLVFCAAPATTSRGTGRIG